MSRLYFHSLHDEAEVRGREEVWLEQVASAQAEHFWGLGSSAVIGQLDRAIQLMGMAALPPDHYLSVMMADAIKERDVADRSWKDAERSGLRWPTVQVSREQRDRFVNAVATVMRTDGLPLRIGEVECTSHDVGLNTALVTGNAQVALAAKIVGWGRAHCWVEGPARAWLADIIATGLESGMYRRGMWYRKNESSTERLWSASGWETVVEFLRSRDDCPVVTSHSVYDGFPNVAATSRWPYDTQQYIRRDDLLSEQEQHLDQVRDWFDSLTLEQQWEEAVQGLREKSPWRQLAPHTLHRMKFHGDLTVFDVFADVPPPE